MKERVVGLPQTQGDYGGIGPLIVDGDLGAADGIKGGEIGERGEPGVFVAGNRGLDLTVHLLRAGGIGFQKNFEISRADDAGQRPGFVRGPGQRVRGKGIGEFVHGGG